MVRVPQAGRDALGDEFLPACGASEYATRRVAPLARYTGIAPRGAPNGSRAQAHETGHYQRPLVLPQRRDDIRKAGKQDADQRLRPGQGEEVIEHHVRKYR